MKRFFRVVFLSLIVVQLCLLPIAVEGVTDGVEVCPSAVTLPATNITASTAVLNGSLIIPPFILNTTFTPNGVLLASLQYAGIPHQERVFVSFQYGTVPGVYTNETPQVEMLQSGTFQASISGLPSCTTHYARVKLHTIVPQPGLFDQYRNNIQGAGVGLDYKHLQQLIATIWDPCPDTYGNVVSFKTTGCQIFTGSHGSGDMGNIGPIAPPPIPALVLVQSAAVAASKVAPGEKVDVTATITNKGGSNGTSKVTLYINGQEVESKGITLSSGQSTTMHFSVSQNDPGTYSVYVNGVPAGSFTVDLFTNNDVLIYGIIALFTIGIIGVLYVVVKRRTV
jgi:hypothetical protein